MVEDGATGSARAAARTRLRWRPRSATARDPRAGRLGAAGRDLRAEEHDIRVWIGRLEALYERLASLGPGSTAPRTNVQFGVHEGMHTRGTLADSRSRGWIMDTQTAAFASPRRPAATADLLARASRVGAERRRRRCDTGRLPPTAPTPPPGPSSSRCGRPRSSPTASARETGCLRGGTYSTPMTTEVNIGHPERHPDELPRRAGDRQDPPLGRADRRRGRRSPNLNLDGRNQRRVLPQPDHQRRRRHPPRQRHHQRPHRHLRLVGSADTWGRAHRTLDRGQPDPRLR